VGDDLADRCQLLIVEIRDRHVESVEHSPDTARTSRSENVPCVVQGRHTMTLIRPFTPPRRTRKAMPALFRKVVTPTDHQRPTTSANRVDERSREERVSRAPSCQSRFGLPGADDGNPFPVRWQPVDTGSLSKAVRRLSGELAHRQPARG
jgi:hypothetical protein